LIAKYTARYLCSNALLELLTLFERRKLSLSMCALTMGHLIRILLGAVVIAVPLH
jgi:hypothetical protein